MEAVLVHLNSIFYLIVCSGQWKGFLVNYKTFAFIQSFFQLVNTIHEIICQPIFKEGQYSCSLKPFFKFFADIPAIGTAFSGQWKQSFDQILHHDYCIQFGVIFEPCAFIQSFFFCCWKVLLKLGANQFSSIFSVPKSGSNFSGQWKRIFYRILFIPRVKTDFFQVLFYLEQILCQWRLLLKFS